MLAGWSRSQWVWRRGLQWIQWWVASPVRSQNLLSYPRSDIEETPCSLDDFLVEEMFINEGSHPATSDGPAGSEDSTAIRSQETPLFSVNQRLFRCLHHASWCNQLLIVAAMSDSILAFFQTSCTWNQTQL